MYPANLLETSCPAKQHGRQWYVLYTKEGEEKSLARELERLGIPFYLPLVPRTQRIRRRTIMMYSVVFPCYVFMFGDEDERVRCLATNHVLRVLRVPDQESLARNLRSLELLIQEGTPLTVESKLAPGERVRVRSGPLAGVEGTVLQRRGEKRFLVAVDFLQQGASFEIVGFLLEPIEGHRGAAEEEELTTDTVVSPPAVYIAWDPEAVGGTQYVRLVGVLGDFVRSRGGEGLTLLRSHGFGVLADAGVYRE
jgi:transcriptional antiterminator RfaH